MACMVALSFRSSSCPSFLTYKVVGRQGVRAASQDFCRTRAGMTTPQAPQTTNKTCHPLDYCCSRGLVFNRDCDPELVDCPAYSSQGEIGVKLLANEISARRTPCLSIHANTYEHGA